jgi:tRNA 2-thiouridine synthesizing protein B
MLLHTVSKSPASSDALDSCLRVIAPGASLLLIEDGVYAALAGGPLEGRLEDFNCYALAADVAARGLTGRLLEQVRPADYGDFVALSLECHAVQSWY